MKANIHLTSSTVPDQAGKELKGVRWKGLWLGRALWGIALWTTVAVGGGTAQGSDTVSLSAREFHRLVYSSHLLTMMEAKPEVESSLLMLLELQRRNPKAAPSALVQPLQQALASYRTNASTRWLSELWRDEILAGFMQQYHLVPGHTNFSQPTFSLLKQLIVRSNAPPVLDQAKQLHAGNQRFLMTETSLAERQRLVQSVTQRAVENAAFREAMEALIFAESGVSWNDSVNGIVNGNSVLRENGTIQALLQACDGEGNLHLSATTITNRFQAEMAGLRQTVATNLAWHAQLRPEQENLLGYLTNQALMQYHIQLEEQVKQGQAEQLAG